MIILKNTSPVVVRKKTKKQTISPEIKKYIFSAIFFFLGTLALLATKESNIGYYLYKTLHSGFGEYYKYIFSPVMIGFSIFLIKDQNAKVNLSHAIGFGLFFTGLVSLISALQDNYTGIFNIHSLLFTQIGSGAAFLTEFVMIIISLILLFRFSPIGFVKHISQKAGNISDITENFKSARTDHPSPKARTPKISKIKEDKLGKKQAELDMMMQELKQEKAALAKAKQPRQLHISEAAKKIEVQKKAPSKVAKLFGKQQQSVEGEEATKTNPEFKNWQFPKLSLLEIRKSDNAIDRNEVRRQEIEIQEKLLQFKIQVDMAGYEIGPTVIQYRLKPKQGVALRKIVNLKQDLTLALHAKSIRIQAPIPGLGVVGIEVPNPNRETVGLREVIGSKAFNNPKLEIPIALGKDVSGNVVVGDLAKMPHLLVAGQTGSGKSVGMNGFLISMLYKFSPSELKMIMVDPKMVELSVYNGIPHLLTPVITNPDKALNALKWCVAEMLRRYDLQRGAGTRNLKEYNNSVAKNKKLPYIVMVIDELADLMMSGNKKEVEANISRIAQMARAVGMHLIIATQRPSVDVITGLIKANVPSRIAFTVASQIDSRTVLDSMGAEDLLGRGDMLYYPTGATQPERVQGVLVETSEVIDVVKKLKLTIDPDMIDNLQISEIANGKSKLEGSILENYKGSQEEDPAIIEKAIELVKLNKKGSTSLIQRKLGLGYARAAKVLDILEELGVVGPSNGSKPREVYVD